MSSPDKQGPRTPKRHPTCPEGSRCQLAGCSCNASSRFSTDEISLDLHEVYGMLGAYPSFRFAGGWLYQHLDTASGGNNVRAINDEAKTTAGTMVYVVQTKIREVSGSILDRISSYLNAEMPV